MKTVFTNRECCHVWASQRQSHGKGSNIFFRDRSIFSYGEHFEMARFITPDLVFITSRTYSVTTSGHLRYVRRALASSLTTFIVPTFDNHQENLQYLLGQAMDGRTETVKARRRADLMAEYTTRAANTALAYRQRFPKSTYKLPHLYKEALKDIQAGEFMSTAMLEEAKVRSDKARKELSEKQKADRERKIILQAAQLEDWKKGEQVYTSFAVTALRLKGDVVQTTRGASVPVGEAKKLYRALDNKVPLLGMRVGLFEVTDLTDITIGCHVIPLSEIARIAPDVLAYTKEVTA